MDTDFYLLLCFYYRPVCGDYCLERKSLTWGVWCITALFLLDFAICPLLKTVDCSFKITWWRLDEEFLPRATTNSLVEELFFLNLPNDDDVINWGCEDNGVMVNCYWYGYVGDVPGWPLLILCYFTFLIILYYVFGWFPINKLFFCYRFTDGKVPYEKPIIIIIYLYLFRINELLVDLPIDYWTLAYGV